MATRQWQRDNTAKYGVAIVWVSLEAGDTSADLLMSDYSDKTIHVFGGVFGDSTISVKGLNSTEASATAQDMHRVNDPTLTFSGLNSETMALCLENPAIIRASASGTTGTALKVYITSKRSL
jgi:hypothetical protein